MSFPLDTADANYAARAAAWTEQDRIFRAIGRRFVATNMNFKTVLIELIKSPLYRATSIVLPANLSAEETATRSAAHSGIGTGQLLSPEQLDAKIRAIAGFGWLRDGTNGIMRDYASMGANNQGLLVHEYYYPYGGINSDTIVRRVTDPSGIIIGVAQRMANEVACIGTAFDFTRPQADRRFFTRVQLDTVPEAGGNPVPANAALIRENIVAMHRLILGETLRVDDPEVDRTFTLFLETWRETRVPAMNMNNLGCDATINPITGVALEMSERITEDTNGTIRAWMAVLSYLFQDYKFLYQ